MRFVLFMLIYPRSIKNTSRENNRKAFIYPVLLVTIVLIKVNYGTAS